MSEEKAPKRGIGTVIVEQLRAGATNEEALVAVKAEFPESNTSNTTVSWYRNDLRKKGESVLTASQARKAKAPASEVDPLA